MDNNRYLTIDGIPVEINGEKNLLALIQKVGIKMPTFCYHSELSTYGACRMCMVEDQWGTLHASCSTPPKPGMEIRTNTERLRKYRKVILELLLANHCRDCTTCDNNEKCKLQDIARRFHIEGVRFPNAASKPDVDDSSPCITIDHHKCILCGDCVRTCNEIQNVGVIDFMNRGSRIGGMSHRRDRCKEQHLRRVEGALRQGYYGNYTDRSGGARCYRPRTGAPGRSEHDGTYRCSAPQNGV